MMIVILGAMLLFTVMTFVYLKKKMMIELNAFQVHSYENEKLLKWLRERDKDSILKYLADFSFAILGISSLVFELITKAVSFTMIGTLSIIASAMLIYLSVITKNKNTKKPLVKTDRVKRMLIPGNIILITLVIIPKALGLILLLCGVFFNTAVFFTLELIYTSILTKCTRYILVLSNNIMKPVEKKINDGFYNDAKRILSEMPNLKIIGITGSYGKTSTKYMVSTILSEKYSVCKTPGSYNTTLGVIRTIRETLDRDDEVFVCEMGARHKGDIKEITDLVCPSAGIITAIGDAHLETFGNIEVTKETKFELARSLKPGDKLYVNIDNKNILNKLASDNEKNLNTYKVVTYSLNDTDADYYATNIKYTPRGAIFDVIMNGHNRETITVETKVLGVHNVYNVLCAIAVADNYGLTKEEIINGTKKIKAVEHRLEILKSTSQITVIDDTFNANPEGTKEALEVLKRMEGNKKIIITPGMIEMGEKEYELNKEFGLGCVKNADVTIMVGKKQTIPMQDAFIEEKVSKEKYYVAENLDDASSYLRQILEVGDVVLYENDMPEDV